MHAAIVIPTIGRSSLTALIDSLAQTVREPFDELILVDDRSRVALRQAQRDTFTQHDTSKIARSVKVLRSGGRGPAAARNLGWRNATAPWICFLDDDVVVARDWAAALERDLNVDDATVGVQGDIEVPLPAHRAPSDWERNVAALSRAYWITADMAYRRETLERLGGFDERFPRAYREDADIALRAQRAGALVRGTRRSLHPVRPADRWISVRLQRGNADDVLMRALHGADWRERAGAGRGLFGAHAAIVASSLIWLALVVRFAAMRITPGPRTTDEIATMLLTSAVIPYAAVYHRLRGLLQLPHMLRQRSQG
jgi:glycosyltransferase involved in cell wall biosynthesis